MAMIPMEMTVPVEGAEAVVMAVMAMAAEAVAKAVMVVATVAEAMAGTGAPMILPCGNARISDIKTNLTICLWLTSSRMDSQVMWQRSLPLNPARETHIQAIPIVTVKCSLRRESGLSKHRSLKMEE